jgi:tol-pal system protein YbgF
MTMTTSTRLGLALVGVLALAAAPAAQNREHQQQAAELRILQEQQQQLSLALAQLADAIKAINGRLDEAAAQNRKGFADQELSTRGLAGDLSAIRERTQETDTRIRTLRDEIDAIRNTLTNLPSLVSQAAPPPPVDGVVDPNAAPPAVGQAPVVQAPAPTTTPAAGLSPARMLDSARTDYFSGDWSLALSGFEALLRTFPRSEAAGEAQFYIGETYYAQNKWREAIDAYGLVLQNHRNSSMVPAAYFKRGRAYAQMNQVDAARASWEAVIKAFPESDDARLAKQDLERINRSNPPAPPPR